MRTKALWALAVGAVLLGGLAAPLEASSQQDAVIRRAFEDVLDREPSDRELRRYRDLMYEEHWSERDIRERPAQPLRLPAELAAEGARTRTASSAAPTRTSSTGSLTPRACASTAAA